LYLGERTTTLQDASLGEKGGVRAEREIPEINSLFFREIHQFIFYRVTFFPNKRESLYF
jgi:hypothetical protein